MQSRSHIEIANRQLSSELFKRFRPILLLVLLAPATVQAGFVVGVTGDGAITSEFLYTLSQVDASSTFITGLGAGNDGEAIAFNPDDGLLYHASGRGLPNSSEILEAIALDTLATVSIALSGDDYNEALAMAYDSLAGAFLLTDLDANLYQVTTNGVVSDIGTMDHVAKGLAFIGSTLYSTSKNDDLLRTIDPLTGLTISVLGGISLPGFTVSGSTGLTANPDTGELLGLLKVSNGFPSRHLVAIDPLTGIATDIGATSDAFAGIAHVPEPGTLVLIGIGLASVALLKGRRANT